MAGKLGMCCKFLDGERLYRKLYGYSGMVARVSEPILQGGVHFAPPGEGEVKSRDFKYYYAF